MKTRAEELCDQLAAGFALLQVTHGVDMSKAAELLNELVKEIDSLQDGAWKYVFDPQRELAASIIRGNIKKLEAMLKASKDALHELYAGP